MAAVKVLACILLAAVVCSAAPSRIVGGLPVPIDLYPSIVQVDFLVFWSNTWSQSCAANILNSRYVLSAAHCFTGPFYEPEARRIRAGASYRNIGGDLLYVEREYNHPTYGSLDLDGDITVVRLRTSLNYSPEIQPVPIVPEGIELNEGTAVVQAGWGAFFDGSPWAVELLDVTIYIFDHELCRVRYADAAWPVTVTQNMICTGRLEVGGADACQGDSGGPLYFGDILLGVISWGQACGSPYYPRISTAISPYSNWIIATAA